jgi:phage gpG-like protein
MEKMNAVHEANLATMQTHIKQRTDATRSFYNQLSVEQEKVFDAETLPEHSRWKGRSN